MYRSVFLKRPIFIGVTGSCAKSTTKELIDAIASTRYCGMKNWGNCNEPWHIVRTILKTSPRDEYCVLEVGAPSPGSLDLPLKLIQPQIAVVTNVGLDHISQYGRIDLIAAEKAKLVRALPSDGTAVLNADDPNVIEMRSACAGRVISYGLATEAMVRAERISSNWPQRLSFTAQCLGQSVEVETQLCGVHWVHSVLAALAVGHAIGIPLTDAAMAIRNVPPFPGRMSPISTADGVTFVRDDYKAPLWTISAALEFMREATAKRKVIIIGTISDYHGNPAQKYPRVARQALDVADVVCFVGEQASMCLRAQRDATGKTLRSYANSEQLLDFLQGFIREGDLVLLKGSHGAENLEQVVTAWRGDRPQVTACSDQYDESSQDYCSSKLASFNGEHDSWGTIVIGLGNPGQEFDSTPHNVGRQTVDVFAKLLGAVWQNDNDALVAKTQVAGHPCLLVKPQSPMNDVGTVLLRMSQYYRFTPADCVVLHDDIHLQPGTVRHRMNGSAGGHKGMQSLIVAFQSEEFPRVKIGVGRPDSNADLLEYVLTPFTRTQSEVAEKACESAAGRVLELIKNSRKLPARTIAK
jgi:aminoacyl-tRNA hydrolase